MIGINSLGKFVAGVGKSAVTLVAAQYTAKGLSAGVEWAVQKVAGAATKNTNQKTDDSDVIDAEDDNVPSFARNKE